MTVGDTTISAETVADGASLLIQPVPGEEWSIRNITYSGGPVEIYYPADGVNDVLYDDDTGRGGRLGYAWDVTNVFYLRIKNTSGGDLQIGYSGIVTKESA